MRTSSAAVLLVLAACSQEPAEKPAVAAADDENAIECALGGANEFSRDCMVEHTEVDGAPVLVVRHPDGGFRRFDTRDGTVVAADGAEQAEVTASGDGFEARVGSDRYRIPATMIGDGR